MPSIMWVLSSNALPCTTEAVCANISDPPTSYFVMTTAGAVRAIAQMSCRAGKVSISSRGITVWRRVDAVSSSGVSPVTVTVSSRAPTASSRSARAVTSAFTTMPAWTRVLKPTSVAVTV